MRDAAFVLAGPSTPPPTPGSVAYYLDVRFQTGRVARVWFTSEQSRAYAAIVLAGAGELLESGSAVVAAESGVLQ